ncbi:MAG: transporter substrate-binding domain-containing protein [Colwellia sp.]|nr:transporter substrate-binding domain-containing protein [Colwellia sp.]
MKNKLILALFFTCIGVVNASNLKNYAVGWELWYPYQYHNKEQQLVGLDFDIFNAIIKEVNIEVTYTELPWKRHLQYIKTGEMDMAMGSSYTPEREKTAYFSVPYRKEKVNLFVKKGMVNKIKINSLAELSNTNYLIGVEGGYYYGDHYQQLMTSKEFQTHINDVIDLEENVDLLFKGHIDGFLVDPVTMNAFSEKYSLEGEFEIHPLEIYQDNIHIMLSRQSCKVEMLTKINKAIIKLKQNGEMDKIINRWTATQQ